MYIQLIDNEILKKSKHDFSGALEALLYFWEFNLKKQAGLNSETVIAFDSAIKKLESSSKVIMEKLDTLEKEDYHAK